LEVLGTEGVMLFDEDHKEQILYTDRGLPRSYVPGLAVNMAFLSSSSSGDWALGDFWGPLANETRAWLDYLSTGRPCALATPEDSRLTLEVTLAIEQSSQKREAVRLPLPAGERH
jgi:predicted dehydrogenase